MFKKTVVVTSGKVGGKLSKSIGKMMDKASETLDAGMKVLDDVLDAADEAVSTTIRIRLTPEQVSDLCEGHTLQFKADGTIIRIERVDAA